MPIDPREIRRYASSLREIITDDRLCDRCRYSLKGLPSDGRCPECGHPIRRRGRDKRFTDNLTDAPLFYLKTLALGLGLMGGAFAAMIVGNMMRAFPAPNPQLGGMLLNGLAALAWWVGVFIVTAQRPLGGHTVRDALLESLWLRRINRAMQACWGIGALLLFLRIRTGSSAVEYAAEGAFLVAWFGLVPLAVQMSSLADWASHTSLSERFKVSAWAMAAFGIVSQVGAMLFAIGGPASGLIRIAAFWSSALAAMGQIVFIFSVYQLAVTAGWAISNARNAAASARRIIDRKADPTAHRTCANCGYSLRGLPLLARCPECGHLDESVRQSGLAVLSQQRRSVDTEIPSVPLEPAPPRKAKPVQPARDPGPPRV